MIIMDATIIHLSDLHFKNDAENRFRLGRLREDLGRIPTTGSVYTAFTGDLIHAGDDNTYNLLFDELISPLLEFGHEILVVPGNHDIQRSLAKKEFADKCLSDRGSSYLFDAEGLTRHPHPDASTDPLHNYQCFEEIFGPYDERSYYGYSRTIGSVSFVGLNTTWLSRERDSNDTDRGKLRVEPYILESLTKNLPSETLKVVLLHHPLDWLEETTRDATSKLITANFDLALFGHVHTSDSTKLAHGDDNCLYIQSPPLRAGWSKGTNGYTIIRCNVEMKRFELDYRSYSASRRAFVRGEDFASNGRKYPRPEDAEFFNHSPSPLALIQKYVDSSPYDYSDWYRNNIRAKSKFYGSFVPPKARRIRQDIEDSLLEPAKPIGGIVRNSNRNQFFISPMDSGSTTAAFLAFKELSEDFKNHHQVPTFFDASQEKINKASILRAMNRTSLTKYTHEETSRLAESGRVVIVVDGLSLSDVEQFNLLREVSEKYFPNVRFVNFISTERQGVVSTGHGDPKLDLDKDEVYEFSQLDVSDIRAMVALRRPDIGEDASDAIVSHVVESFRQMDEPIYASTVAVIVETLSQDLEFKPVNKARLLERYVECLLGRFDLEDVREGIFASSDKIDLLSYVARKFLEQNRLGIDQEDWNKVCLDYQDRYLIELPKGLLEEFIEKGLLTLFNGKITFRGDYLFSFFVARQMKADPAFAESLLANDGLFKHHREIVFYGELEGTDTSSVLNSIYLVLGEIEEPLIENYSREGVDITSEWLNTCAEDSELLAGNLALHEAANQLQDTKPTPENADRISDAQLAEIHRRRGVAQRVVIKEAEAKLLVGMKLYALLIKNSLQVPAPDKLRHLQKLYEAAELWVGFMCSRRSEITSNPLVLAGGVLFINTGAAINPQKSAKDFKYAAPNSVSRILSEAVRNPQLAVALRTVMPKLSPMGMLFARDALLEIPGKENRSAYIGTLVSESNKTLMTSSLRSLRTRFLASGRRKDQRNHIEKIVDELKRNSAISGKTNFDQLKKARLVRDMKEHANKEKSSNKKTLE